MQVVVVVIVWGARIRKDRRELVKNLVSGAELANDVASAWLWMGCGSARVSGLVVWSGETNYKEKQMSFNLWYNHNKYPPSSSEILLFH